MPYIYDTRTHKFGKEWNILIIAMLGVGQLFKSTEPAVGMAYKPNEEYFRRFEENNSTKEYKEAKTFIGEESPFRWPVRYLRLDRWEAKTLVGLILDHTEVNYYKQNR